MAEIRDADASIRRFSVGATLILCPAVVGIPYAFDRAYRRWSKENHLLAGPRASLARARTGYQEKRTNVSEVAQDISSVLIAVALATSKEARVRPFGGPRSNPSIEKHPLLGRW
jgi:hypothetical protein